MKNLREKYVEVGCSAKDRPTVEVELSTVVKSGREAQRPRTEIVYL